MGKRLRIRDPDRVVALFNKRLVIKITIQKPEFPELIGDVFSGVGDDAVGADQYFLLLLAILEFHDPAA